MTNLEFVYNHKRLLNRANVRIFTKIHVITFGLILLIFSPLLLPNLPILYSILHWTTSLLFRMKGNFKFKIKLKIVNLNWKNIPNILSSMLLS